MLREEPRKTSSLWHKLYNLAISWLLLLLSATATSDLEGCWCSKQITQNMQKLKYLLEIDSNFDYFPWAGNQLAVFPLN